MSDDDRTRVAAPEDGDRPGDATRITAADDATRVAGERTGTESNWSHPERWRGAGTADTVGIGTVLKERFLLEELVGHGGMGAVYRARDRRKEEAEDSEPFVALKLLNDEFRQHPDALVALQREAKKAQALAHPNIVTVYDFDRDGVQVYLSMEFLRGEPLDVVIRRRGGGLPAKEALQIVEHMSRGLAYAHQQGIAHSDFKPGNVFLTAKGNVKVLDFGIARAARVGTGGADDRTRFDPTTLGAITPAYASAEMLDGQAPEPADDVYALACITHELLTGEHPFLDSAGRKLPANEARRRGLRAPMLKQVPRRVARAIARGLAFDRAGRFADAGVFLEAIRPPVRLRRTAVAALVGLALVATASWWFQIRDSDLLVTLDDLPPGLAQSRDLIVRGDNYQDAGDFPQAHKNYALAWKSAEDGDVGADSRGRLRVLVDRRVDAVIGHYLEESRREDLDPFTLEVLHMSLESLARSDLGTRREDIERALVDLDAHLKDSR